MGKSAGNFVSRAGEKLSGALDAFALDVSGAACADFGCNIGGFTDCLLRRGASKVYAVDTGYGQLAWKLRNDSCVVVMERTNALYCPPPQSVDIVTIDVAWTPQELIVPAAVRWLKAGGSIVSLLKPHYELAKMQRRTPAAAIGEVRAGEVCLAICGRLAALGCCVRAAVRSALRGKGGNVEFFLLVTPGG